MGQTSATVGGNSRGASRSATCACRARARVCSTASATRRCLRFDRLTAHLPGVTLLGKAEWYNPGGSVKDRAAANIVAEGRRSGKFTSGKILLDATSGNTGIAYAMLGAAEGFPVTLCMPQNVSAERKHILQRLRREHYLYRPRRRLRRRHSQGARTVAAESRSIFLRRPILQRRQLAGPLSQHRQRNLAADRGPASLTSSPCSAPAAPLWAPPAA